MNEDVLWYVARVSGLMGLVLAYGSLICSVLVRTRSDDVSSPSRLWADDACRFLGLSCLVFTAVHGASIAANSMFDTTPEAMLTLRDGENWLETGLIVGILSAWALLVANILRFLDARVAAAGSIRTLLIAAVVIGSAIHAWMTGSDIQNVVAYAVAGLAVVVAAVALGLAVSSGRNSDPLHEALGSTSHGPLKGLPEPREADGQPSIAEPGPGSIWSSPRQPDWADPVPRAEGLEQEQPELGFDSYRPPVELPELSFSRTIDEQQSTDETNGNGDGSHPIDDRQIPEIEGARLVESPDAD